MITVTGVVGENVHGLESSEPPPFKHPQRRAVPAKRSRPENRYPSGGEFDSTSTARHRPYLSPAFPEAKGGSN